MASGGKSVAVMPPPAAPPNFDKYRDAATNPDSMTTPAAAAEAAGCGGGPTAGQTSIDQKVSDCGKGTTACGT